jgi:hypothetical protein
MKDQHNNRHKEARQTDREMDVNVAVKFVIASIISAPGQRAFHALRLVK